MRQLNRRRRVRRALKWHELGGGYGGLAGEWNATIAGARYAESTFVTVLFVWVIHKTLLRLQVGYERRSLSSWWASQHLNC